MGMTMTKLLLMLHEDMCDKKNDNNKQSLTSAGKADSKYLANSTNLNA